MTGTQGLRDQFIDKTDVEPDADPQIQDALEFAAATKDAVDSAVQPSWERSS